MPRFIRTFILPTIGLAVAAGSAWSQSLNAPASSAKKSDTVSPILAPAPAEPAPAPGARRPRTVSSDVAAALAAAAPKYEALPPKPEPKPEAEQVDLREVDKPKNTIVRLPTYMVREQKPPVFRERDIYTKKGLEEIAMRRYISDADRALNGFALPFIGASLQARAMAMYQEDERLRNMTDLHNNAVDAARVDRAGGEYIRKEAQKTFLRSSDFGWSSGEPR